MGKIPQVPPDIWNLSKKVLVVSQVGQEYVEVSPICLEGSNDLVRVQFIKAG